MSKKLFALAAIGLILACAKGRCSAQEILTLQLVKEKVIAAAKLIEEQGETAFPALKDPDGQFRFAAGKGYIWVHDLAGVFLLQPSKPELEGVNQLDLKDSNDFYFIKAMNDLVRKQKEGWVVYFWPKPGKKTSELKGSFVKLAVKNGKEYVVGCGMYDVSKDYIRSVYPQDMIYDAEYPGTAQ
jgi:signal transduction histidine kinase